MTVLAVAGMLALAPSAAAASDKLPDLGMAKLRDFRTETKSNGTRLLRFTTIIVNVGAGRFRLRGTRPNTGVSEMTTKQRIWRTDGTHYDVSTPAVMYWAGDGHNHWHIRDLQESWLERLDSGDDVGVGAKQGFCFYDNSYYRTLPGTPGSAYFTGCGYSKSLLGVTMGLSVGWGDKYAWHLMHQWVEITGLAPGDYRLWVFGDTENWFAESNNDNNGTWADLRLTNSSVTLLARGPGA